MNDKNIQEILKIEKKAREMYDAAVREAEQLPIQAEQDGQVMIEKARAEAQAESRDMISRAEAREETAKILAAAEEKARQMEVTAKKNFDKAVEYVLQQVVGGQ